MLGPRKRRNMRVCKGYIWFVLWRIPLLQAIRWAASLLLLEGPTKIAVIHQEIRFGTWPRNLRCSVRGFFCNILMNRIIDLYLYFHSGSSGPSVPYLPTFPNVICVQPKARKKIAFLFISCTQKPLFTQLTTFFLFTQLSTSENNISIPLWIFR